MAIHTLKELRKELEVFPDDMLVEADVYMGNRKFKRRKIWYVSCEHVEKNILTIVVDKN